MVARVHSHANPRSKHWRDSVRWSAPLRLAHQLRLKDRGDLTRDHLPVTVSLNIYPDKSNVVGTSFASDTRLFVPTSGDDTSVAVCANSKVGSAVLIEGAVSLVVC